MASITINISDTHDDGSALTAALVAIGKALGGEPTFALGGDALGVAKEVGRKLQGHTVLSTEGTIVNDGAEPEIFTPAPVADVSDLPEAPAAEPEPFQLPPEPEKKRTRRTKEELAQAIQLEEQGYTKAQIKSYQLEGKPLPGSGTPATVATPAPVVEQRAPGQPPAALPPAEPEWQAPAAATPAPAPQQTPPPAAPSGDDWQPDWS